MKAKIKQLSNPAIKAKIARTNLLLFSGLAHNLTSRGFERTTEETLRKNAERFGLEPPNSKRIKETKDQVSYERWFEGDLCIVVHTSFNPNLGKAGEFTKKGGCGWVLITEKFTKRIYARPFKRIILMENFINRMINEAAFLVDRVKNRPVVPRTSQLFKIKQTYTETFYVSPLDKKDKRPFDNGKIPGHLKEHFRLMDYRNKYYQKTIRPLKGIVDRARDKRKLWKVRV